jgi:hypothetical protein
MPLDNINYAVGQDTMQEAFDKINLAIDQIDTNTTAISTIYTDGQMPNGIETDGTLLKTKVVQIGDWNMDTTQQVSVAHSISDFTKIRSVSAMILNDASGTLFNLISAEGTTGSAADNTQIVCNSTNIILGRKTGGIFDQSLYDSTSFNRGFITITYEV